MYQNQINKFKFIYSGVYNYVETSPHNYTFFSLFPKSLNKINLSETTIQRNKNLRAQKQHSQVNAAQQSHPPECRGRREPVGQNGDQAQVHSRRATGRDPSQAIRSPFQPRASSDQDACV